MFGNFIFTPFVRTKDLIAALGEVALIRDEGKRSKTLTLKVSKEYRDFAKKYVKDRSVKAELSGGRFDEKGLLQELRQIYETQWLEKVTKFNSNLLEKEDYWFKSKHFVHALSSYLQSRHVDLNNIDEKTLTQARIYAINEARKATFQDASIIADMLNSITAPKRFKEWVGDRNAQIVSSIFKYGIEGVLPFKRTPINIIKRGVEYSPLGLLNSMTVGLNDVLRHNITVSEFCDGLASGLTGTGVALLGYLLASAGWITGGMGDDEEDKFEKLNGEQAYAIQIFGHSFTVDWAAPACIPFFMGVELSKEIDDSDGFQLKDLGKSAINILEPITELSMLSGVQSLIEGVRYAESGEMFSTIFTDIGLSFFMQSVPSLFGAAGRTIDSKQRSWYVDKNSSWPDFIQNLTNQVKSKIPGLTQTMPVKVDAWGREVSRGGVGERVAENFVSPGYFSKYEYTETDKEIKRIYKATGENVFPQTAAKHFKVDKEEKYLTADEYVTYAKNKGQYSFDYVQEFINSKEYKSLDDDERADVIKNLYKFANAKAKSTVSDYDVAENKLYKTVFNWEQSGYSAVDYYIYSALKNQ